MGGMRRGGEQKKYSGGQGRTHSFTFFFRVWGRGGRGKKREMGRPSARRRRPPPARLAEESERGSASGIAIFFPPLSSRAPLFFTAVRGNRAGFFSLHSFFCFVGSSPAAPRAAVFPSAFWR